jgi:hypothetical protein
MAHRTQEGPQLLHLLLGAVHGCGRGGELPLHRIGGHEFVGEEHEVLDEPVAVELHDALDVHRGPLGVEHHPRLGKVEVQRTPARRRSRRDRARASSSRTTPSTSSETEWSPARIPCTCS